MPDVTPDDELRRQAERAHALVEVSQLLAEAVTDSSRLIALILDRVAHLVGDAVTIWLLRPGADHLDAAGTSHPDPEARRLLEEIQASLSYRSDDDLTRPVIESGDRLVIADFDLAARRADVHPAYLPWLDRYGASSLAVLPMRARGRVIGAIGTTRDAGRPPYTEGDIDFMQALADCTVAARRWRKTSSASGFGSTARGAARSANGTPTDTGSRCCPRQLSCREPTALSSAASRSTATSPSCAGRSTTRRTTRSPACPTVGCWTIG